MKSITVMSDIHGNMPALEAVFFDMRARNLENLYCLGDLVGYGVQPNEVIEAIKSRGIPTIYGNYDEGVGVSGDDCGCAYKTKQARELGDLSIAWTNTHTSEENKAYLRSLAFQWEVRLGDLKVMLVHGSPRKVNEYLYEDRPDNSFERLLDMVKADVLVCGHTHLPYHKVLPSERQVVNVGSVGKPKDSNPKSCYVVMVTAGNQLEVQFIRVAYDVDKAARMIEAAEMPNEFAQMLRDGKG